MAGTEARIGKLERHAKGLTLYPVGWSLQAGGCVLIEKNILGTCFV